MRRGKLKNSLGGWSFNTTDHLGWWSSNAVGCLGGYVTCGANEKKSLFSVYICDFNSQTVHYGVRLSFFGIFHLPRQRLLLDISTIMAPQKYLITLLVSMGSISQKSDFTEFLYLYQVSRTKAYQSHTHAYTYFHIKYTVKFLV